MNIYLYTIPSIAGVSTLAMCIAFNEKEAEIIFHKLKLGGGKIQKYETKDVVNGVLIHE